MNRTGLPLNEVCPNRHKTAPPSMLKEPVANGRTGPNVGFDEPSISSCLTADGQEAGGRSLRHRDSPVGERERRGDGQPAASTPTAPVASRTTPTAGALTECRLPAEYIERARVVRQALDSSSPAAAADERLLHELIAGDMPVALALQDAQAELVRVLQKALHNPELALSVAKVMRETVALTSAVSRRIEASLMASGSLRAQRRFLALNRGKDGI